MIIMVLFILFFKSDLYRDTVLIRYNQWGYYPPSLLWIVVPGLLSLITVLLNISLIVVTIMNMYDLLIEEMFDPKSALVDTKHNIKKVFYKNFKNALIEKLKTT